MRDNMEWGARGLTTLKVNHVQFVMRKDNIPKFYENYRSGRGFLGPHWLALHQAILQGEVYFQRRDRSTLFDYNKSTSILMSAIAVSTPPDEVLVVIGPTPETSITVKQLRALEKEQATKKKDEEGSADASREDTPKAQKQNKGKARESVADRIAREDDEARQEAKHFEDARVERVRQEEEKRKADHIEADRIAATHAEALAVEHRRVDEERRQKQRLAREKESQNAHVEADRITAEEIEAARRTRRMERESKASKHLRRNDDTTAAPLSKCRVTALEPSKHPRSETPPLIASKRRRVTAPERTEPSKRLRSETPPSIASKRRRVTAPELTVSSKSAARTGLTSAMKPKALPKPPTFTFGGIAAAKPPNMLAQLMAKDPQLTAVALKSRGGFSKANVQEVVMKLRVPPTGRSDLPSSSQPIVSSSPSPNQEMVHQVPEVRPGANRHRLNALKYSSQASRRSVGSYTFGRKPSEKASSPDPFVEGSSNGSRKRSK